MSKVNVTKMTAEKPLTIPDSKFASTGCAKCAKAAIGTAPDSAGDTFCRHCGCRLLVQCSQCSKLIRQDDQFCVHCGKRRYAIVEAIKNQKDTFLTIGAIVSVAAAIGAACYLIRQKGQK